MDVQYKINHYLIKFTFEPEEVTYKIFDGGELCLTSSPFETLTDLKQATNKALEVLSIYDRDEAIAVFRRDYK